MLQKYAQEISDSTAQAIGYPVFITDMEGIIIGCSDPDRGLGTLHEASLRAIETKTGYLEDEEEARRFRGTNKGATYPIEDSSGMVVGTVAITGDPEKVAPFAQVVKKQAEILLREKLLAEVVMNQERTLQNLIQDIAHFDPQIDDAAIMAAKAKYFGYDGKMPYVVIAIELSRTEEKEPHQDSAQDEITFQALKNQAVYQIKNIFSKPQDVCSAIGDDRYIILRALYRNTLSDHQTLWEAIDDQCFRINQVLAKGGWLAHIGISSIAESIPDLSVAYRESLEAVFMGKRLSTGRHIHYIKDYRVEEIILSANRQRIKNFISLSLKNLQKQADWDELRDTLAAWCENQFNLAQAAGQLHIHRNTLDYRLGKIERISGINPRDFRQILNLYLAVRMDLLVEAN